MASQLNVHFVKIARFVRKFCKCFPPNVIGIHALLNLKNDGLLRYLAKSSIKVLLYFIGDF